MEAIVPPEEVDYFKEHLSEGKIYYFCRVQVTPVDEKFRLVPYRYKISFKEDTIVDHISNYSKTIPFYWSYITTLSNVSRFVGQDLQLIGMYVF